MYNFSRFSRLSALLMPFFLIPPLAARADIVLIDHTFDGVANDTGGLTFQKVDNVAGSVAGMADLSTGLITTGTSTVTGGGNSNVGFNTTSSVSVGTLAPSATGFKITFTVSSTDVNVSALSFNGLFFGVVSGTDANGTTGTSLWINNPHAFGYVAGSGIPGSTTNAGYGDNLMRQDAQGGATNEINSVNFPLGGTAPTDASFNDGFTVTISLFNNNTWKITSTGLSTDLNGSGTLATTGTGMFNYSAISAALTPYVSLQGKVSGSITVDRIKVTAIEPPKILSMAKVGSIFTVQFQGSEGETYNLNKSTILDFSTLNSTDSILLNGTGIGELEDSGATENAAFYRVEQQ